MSARNRTAPAFTVGDLCGRMRRQTLMKEPWEHVYIRHFIDAAAARLLSEKFPSALLSMSSRQGSQKDYRFRTANVTDWEVLKLPTVWRDALAALSDNAYRDAISDVVDISLSDARLSLSLWEYQVGDYLAPHLDKEEKLVTQILYLGRGWRSGTGGRFVVMRSAHPDDVAGYGEPTLGSSVLLVRSSRSWHAVESYRGRVSRRSLNITYWRNDPS